MADRRLAGPVRQLLVVVRRDRLCLRLDRSLVCRVVRWSQADERLAARLLRLAGASPRKVWCRWWIRWRVPRIDRRDATIAASFPAPPFLVVTRAGPGTGVAWRVASNSVQVIRVVGCHRVGQVGELMVQGRSVVARGRSFVT